MKAYYKDLQLYFGSIVNESQCNYLLKRIEAERLNISCNGRQAYRNTKEGILNSLEFRTKEKLKELQQQKNK